MSSWKISCTNSDCGRVTEPDNIAELTKPENGYLDDQGWFLCEWCRGRGCISKTFTIQEGGAPWKPCLKGIIRPNGYEGNTYQPFAFLVSDSPQEHPDQVWFCYYKDTRKIGGRLKMGHGPGGPPVFAAQGVLDLMVQIVRSGCLDKVKVVDAIRDA